VLVVLLLQLLLQRVDLHGQSGRCVQEVLLVCASCWTCGCASELCGTSSVSVTSDLLNSTDCHVRAIVVDGAYKLIGHCKYLCAAVACFYYRDSCNAGTCSVEHGVVKVLLLLHVYIAAILNTTLYFVNTHTHTTAAYDVALAFVSIGTAVLSLLLLSLLIIENGKLNARVYLMCVAVRAAASFGQCIFAGTAL
jgi:hypothetical protein